MNAKLSMICSKQSNGSYFAVCPEIKGCFTQGDTYEETLSQLKELVEVTIREGIDKDELEYIAQTESKIFSNFEVEIPAV